MKRAFLVVMCLAAVACMTPAAPAAPAKVLGSIVEGISADHRYYLGWGQSWKAKERDESLRQQVLTNVHSPEMYRAMGRCEIFRSNSLSRRAAERIAGVDVAGLKSGFQPPYALFRRAVREAFRGHSSAGQAIVTDRRGGAQALFDVALVQ